MRIISRARACPVRAEKWRELCELSLEMQAAAGVITKGSGALPLRPSLNAQIRPSPRKQQPCFSAAHFGLSVEPEAESSRKKGLLVGAGLLAAVILVGVLL